jgi:type II secretory pathway component PulC
MRWLVLLTCLVACSPTPPPTRTASDCGRERDALAERVARAERRIAELEARPEPTTPVVEVPAPTSVPRPERLSDRRFRVPRAFVDDLLENQARTMKQARLVPVTKDGRVTGIRLFAIREGTPLSELGFQNGDELRAINRRSLTSAEEALEAYTDIRGASSVDVELVRGGTPMTLHYDVVDAP